jgi:hypothetical protein
VNIPAVVAAYVMRQARRPDDAPALSAETATSAFTTAQDTRR